MAKKYKDDVGYSNGKPNAHCGICKHFIPEHECELVAGYIQKSMWCRLYSAKETET